MVQQVYEGSITEGLLSRLITQTDIHRLMLVCDDSIQFLPFGKTVCGMSQIKHIFSAFTSNPTYESVRAGVDVFQKVGCDGILAVGGGSAIDVAKCIKLFSGMNKDRDYLVQPFLDTKIPLFAVPTTAGTGSESTHFAVVYKDDVKHSVAHQSLVPNVVVLDATALHTLPLYQKKCTMLDAMCQSIESWWSLASTTKSVAFSREALTLLLQHEDSYLQGKQEAAAYMLRASNLAGQAINITTTTAAHAMSYQLTKLYGLPHGHAVAICFPGVWRYMLQNREKCHDPRGSAHLYSTFKEIAKCMGHTDVEAAIKSFEVMLGKLDLQRPAILEDHLASLVGSVNSKRLGNNPVMLSEEALSALYKGEYDNL